VFAHHLDIYGISFKDLNEGDQVRFDIEHLMHADAKPFAYNKTLSEGICYIHLRWTPLLTV
jgi:cold shock CspA family protein